MPAQAQMSGQDKKDHWAARKHPAALLSLLPALRTYRHPLQLLRLDERTSLRQATPSVLLYLDPAVLHNTVDGDRERAEILVTIRPGPDTPLPAFGQARSPSSNLTLKAEATRWAAGG